MKKGVIVEKLKLGHYYPYVNFAKNDVGLSLNLNFHYFQNNSFTKKFVGLCKISVGHKILVFKL